MKAGMTFRLEDYNFELPDRLIAKYPLTERHNSKLMVLHRGHGRWEHRRFCDLPDILSETDCLILNDTKVFPARLFGKKPTGGRVEVVLLNFPSVVEEGRALSEALVRSSKPLRPGQRIIVGTDLEIEIMEGADDWIKKISLMYDGELLKALETHGHVPLPPYIRRQDEDLDKKRYQTIFAKNIGSVAAPTAGLHFSDALLKQLKDIGVKIAYITLHVGYGTFAPVRTEDIREHKIHSEWIDVPSSALQLVRTAKANGSRIICVGTTTVRALEYVFKEFESADSYSGPCDLYIYPGFTFRATDAIITNFHLPKSSLLILVSAFAGRDLILSAYNEAVKAQYRFYSYGDSMLILP